LSNAVWSFAALATDAVAQPLFCAVATAEVQLRAEELSMDQETTR
jgi:hypothetical protein